MLTQEKLRELGKRYADLMKVRGDLLEEMMEIKEKFKDVVTRENKRFDFENGSFVLFRNFAGWQFSDELIAKMEEEKKNGIAKKKKKEIIAFRLPNKDQKPYNQLG